MRQSIIILKLLQLKKENNDSKINCTTTCSQSAIKHLTHVTQKTFNDWYLLAFVVWLCIKLTECGAVSCRHAITWTSQLWRHYRHERLQLQIGLFAGLHFRGLQYVLLPSPGVVWEKLPCSVRSSGKSQCCKGEADQLEEGGSCC